MVVSTNHMPWILGLDLGTSTLGWAVIDVDVKTAGNIVPVAVRDIGVRLFDAGVKGDIQRGKDSSRAAVRREARQPRRQLWRRQQRKRKLFTILTEFGLLPKSESNDAATRKKIFDDLDRELAEVHLPKQNSGETTAVYHILHQKLPYILRDRAANEKVRPFELGRALYHLGQRRGYLSNRKGQSDDEKQGKVAACIGDLAEEMNGQLLGEFFARDADPDAGQIRGRYTAREMYRKEFDRIRKTQSPHFRKLTKEKWKQIESAIFFQRPLKSQKNLIGRCGLEPGRRRCAAALPIFQEFRILQTVNNLRLYEPGQSERPLSADERQKLVDALQTTSEMTFAAVKKHLDLPRTVKFTLEEWEKRIVGHRTNAKMINAFADRWLRLPAEQRDQITLEVLHYVKPQALAQRAKKAWRLDPNAAQTLAETHLEEGYARHSRIALEKLVEVMREGTPHETARKQLYPEVFESEEPLIRLPALKDCDFELTNPAVRRALTELRKVVNFLIRKYGRPELIRIELARDLKNSRDRRVRIWKNNNDRRKRREAAISALIKEFKGREPSQADIEKWLLAEECGWKCPYTGKQINYTNLFGSHPQFDIEHIYPRKYLDNSFSNKTLCHHEFNRKRKRDMLPFVAFSVNADEWDAILQRVQAFQEPFDRQKLKRFEATEVDDGFTQRHLNDTRYNSSLAADYLGKLYGGRISDSDDDRRQRIFTPTGGLTAMLRSAWQLNRILSPHNEKTRDDNRHHAIDTIVIALSDQGLVQRLGNLAEAEYKRRNERFLNMVDDPWKTFAADAKTAVEGCVVSTRITHGISGSLHAETLYSKPHQNKEGAIEYRIRKQLHKLSARDITEGLIVDPIIRQLVLDKYQKLGGKNPKTVFADPVNHPEMTALDGRKIPIHKVRVRIDKQPRTIGEGLREQRIISGTGSNYASMIYAELDEKGNEVRWFDKIVTRLEAYERLSANRSKRGEKVLIPEASETRRFKFSLRRNDALLLEGPDGKDVLYRVQKISKGDIQLCEHIFPIVPKQDKWNRIRSMDTLRRRNIRRVTVSPISEVHRIGD